MTAKSSVMIMVFKNDYEETRVEKKDYNICKTNIFYLLWMQKFSAVQTPVQS